MDDNEQMIQTVYITVKGKMYTFTGFAIPAVEGDFIEEIKFSKPRKLPKDYKIEEVIL